MNLCLICLRSDRLLKNTSKMLEEFHDELCGYSEVKMGSPYYCSECEYLLMKFYKFKQKCLKALEIFEEWMSQPSKIQPSNVLHTLLPTSSLGMWTPNPKRIGNYTLKEIGKSPIDLSSDDEFTEDINMQEIKISLYCESHNSDNINLFADALNNEHIFNNVSENIVDNVSENIVDNVSDFVDIVTKSEQIKIRNESNTEEYLSSKYIETDESGDEDNKNTNSNVTNKTGVGDKTKTLKSKKVAGKRGLKNCEKGPKKKKISELKNSKKGPSKKMLAKKKVYFDQLKKNNQKYESVFDIEYLTTHEKQLDEFQRRKTYDCYVKADYKCKICYQVVKTLKFLDYHMTKWHNESAGTVLCPICNTWNSKTGNHKTTHNVVYKCKLCPLVTYHRNSVQNHFEQHEGKMYHCEQCNISYKSKSTYHYHLGQVHRLGRHVCEGCGRGFRSPLGLSIHKIKSVQCTVSKETTASKATDGVRCDECDVTLLSQEVYDAHILDVHEARYGVGIPGHRNSLGLPRNKTLARPRTKARLPRSTLNHSCRLCNTADVKLSWFELQLHYKREHPDVDVEQLYGDKRNHLCDVCGLGFTSVYLLRDHMHKHTGALPFACSSCSKRYRTSYLLREHRRRHLPPALACARCGGRFRTRGNLCSHMKIHTDEKTYKCESCGKAFRHNCSLKEHIRGVHLNIRRARHNRSATRGGGRGGGRQKTKLISDGDFDDNTK